ncbi:MAG: uL15 family ribosomal protein, partial [Bacilli bacterium]|nr:uL15 family ribosomal protein [Bacilli bacterium]MBQ6817368.1 uL15 family ribosomal protein [Bacilli bacterium]
KFEEGAVVTPELLKEMGLVKKQLDGIKVLGNGTLTKKITVKAHKFSDAALREIEKIGGKAEVI